MILQTYALMDLILEVGKVSKATRLCGGKHEQTKPASGKVIQSEPNLEGISHVQPLLLLDKETYFIFHIKEVSCEFKRGPGRL